MGTTCIIAGFHANSICPTTYQTRVAEYGSQSLKISLSMYCFVASSKTANTGKRKYLAEIRLTLKYVFAFLHNIREIRIYQDLVSSKQVVLVPNSLLKKYRIHNRIVKYKLLLLLIRMKYMWYSNTSFYSGFVVLAARNACIY